MNEACNSVAPVIERYKETLVRFIGSRIECADDRDELVSQVMMKVYDNCEKLPEIRNLESWLITISRNSIVDFHRSNSKMVFGALPEMVEEGEQTRLYQDLADCIPGLIEKLPEKYRDPLHDYEMKGIPQKQLAKIYGMSESGLKSRVQRARKMLRTSMLEYCGQYIKEEEECNSCDCSSPKG